MATQPIWDSPLAAGVDEAGRGPLAGPVVAAAVIFPPRTRIKGLRDSKKLSSKRREELFAEITLKALAIGVGIVDHRLIDKMNIHHATLLAMRRAVMGLQQGAAGLNRGASKIRPHIILVDGKFIIPKLSLSQRAIVDGDDIVPVISAASIIAKVTRDRMMMVEDGIYPEYGFRQHKGYGTPKHLEALSRMGPTPIHRRSFRPVRELVH